MVSWQSVTSEKMPLVEAPLGSVPWHGEGQDQDLVLGPGGHVPCEPRAVVLGLLPGGARTSASHRTRFRILVLPGSRSTEDPGAVQDDHLERSSGTQAEPRLRGPAAHPLQQQRLHHLHRQLRRAAAAARDGGRALPRAPHHHHPQPRRRRRVGGLWL